MSRESRLRDEGGRGQSVADRGSVARRRAAVRGRHDPDATPKGASADQAGEVELVERVLKARKDYWTSLDKLRQHYVATNEIEKAKWVEDELKSYHRMMKYSYRLDVKDVPPPTLQPKQNVTEANNLFRRGRRVQGPRDWRRIHRQPAPSRDPAPGDPGKVPGVRQDRRRGLSSRRHLRTLSTQAAIRAGGRLLRTVVPVEQGVRDRRPPAGRPHLRPPVEDARQSQGTVQGRHEPRHQPRPASRRRRSD